MTDPALGSFFERSLDVLLLTAPDTPRAVAFAEALAELGLTVRIAPRAGDPSPTAACVVCLDPEHAPAGLSFDTASWTGTVRTPAVGALLREIGPRVGRPGLADWAAIRLEEDPEALRRWAEAHPQDPAVEEAWGRLEALETDALHAHLERARAAFAGQPAVPAEAQPADGAPVRPEPGLWPRPDAVPPARAAAPPPWLRAGSLARGRFRGAPSPALILAALVVAGGCALAWLAVGR